MAVLSAKPVGAGVIVWRAVLISAGLSCGCARPSLTEDFRIEHFRGFPNPNERFDQSDMVLLGVIDTVDRVGAPRKAAMRSPIDTSILLQQVSFRVQVEHAFKRQPAFPAVEVHGHLFSDQNERQLGHPLPFLPKQGERRLLFLRLEGDRLRLLHDVFDYSLRVRSGRHEGVAPGYSSSAKRAVSWLLLTPGPDSSAESFASRLWEHAWYVQELAGVKVTQELLKPLVAHPSPRLQAAAADALHALSIDR